MVNTSERRVLVGIKVSTQAKELLTTEAAKEKTTVSNLGRQWLAIGYREWKKGKR